MRPLEGRPVGGLDIGDTQGFVSMLRPCNGQNFLHPASVGVGERDGVELGLRHPDEIGREFAALHCHPAVRII